MKEIELTKGYVAIVDDSDYPLVSQFKWSTNKIGINAYAVTSIPSTTMKRKFILMHRLLIGLTGDDQSNIHIDHISGNSLDNQRSNLRIVTRQQNNMNQRLTNRNTSGYKGVSWNKKSKKYRAAICCNKKQHHLGFFNTAEEASKAYEAKAVELFGQYKRENYSKGY